MLRTTLHKLRYPLIGAGAAALTVVAVGSAANGDKLTLGQSNSATAQTSLSAPVAGGKALQLTNTSTNTGSTALGLSVASGHAPFTVNSASKVASLNSDFLDGFDSHNFWKLSGNAGTMPGSDFLGTTDNAALVLKVNGHAALRLKPDATSPDVIGGFSGNAVEDGAHGATIAGGGLPVQTNRAYDHFGTVGGGWNNVAGTDDGNPETAESATVAGGFNNAATEGSAIAGGAGNRAGGNYSSIAGGVLNRARGYGSAIPGGENNDAFGKFSFAAGSVAKAYDDGSFVWADYQPDHNVSISSYGTNTFTARTTGGARFISAIDVETGAPTAGVQLAAGGGSWSSLSDRAAKRGFTPVDRRQLLSRLNRVPITRWGYKAQQPSIRHLGPTAQDFYSAFGLGEDNKHIDSIDSEGVALGAIQGLYRQNQALERQNRTLNVRLTRLERAIAKLSH